MALEGAPGTPAGAPAPLRRAAALCEFLGVFFLSIAVLRALNRALGLSGWKTVQAEMLASGKADFLVLARLAAVDQILRYGVLLAAAFVIGWWHRRRPPARYGLTRAGRGWGELAAIGVALWGVNKLLPALLLAADDHLPWIGQGPDHWALFPSRWTLEFLLFMAASSFLLVPVVEELAFRGYLVTRLREDFGEAGALTLAAVLFALVHMQYFKLEVLAVGMILSLAIAALATGLVLLRTGSLVPCVVAHAIQNLPIPPGEWSEEAQLAVALAVVWIARRPIARWLRDFGFVVRRDKEWAATGFGLLVLIIGLGSALAFERHLDWVAAALLVAGIGGDALDRYARRRLEVKAAAARRW